MTRTFIKSLLIVVPFLATPMVVSGQSNASYSFSSAQFCSLSDAGEVNCDLSTGYERLQAPSNLPPLTALTVGEAHACGITLEGQPICWGGNFYGQLNAPVVDIPLVQINAGANHTCALDTNGEAVCWGINTNRQLEVPEGITFTQIEAAQLESCGVKTDGEIMCWSDDFRRSPQDLVGPFVKIDLRSGAACGLTENGEIRCADNSVFTVPIKPTTPYITPPNNSPYIDMAATRDAVCGLESDGSLHCAFIDSEVANQYPLGEKFISIQSNETDIIINTRSPINGNLRNVFSGTAMCGQRFDGSFECWAESAIFSGPNGKGASNAELVASLELDLDARIYDTSAVELFWTPLPFNSLGTNASLEPIVEVFRNGELVASRRARFSYFDTKAEANSEYQIQLVDEVGNRGPLSNVLTVNTADRTVLFNGEPTLMASRSVNLPDVFTNITTGSLSVGIVVGWDVNPDVESRIDGYEIRVNGVPAGFTRSQLFVDTKVPQRGRCVEIIAVGFDETRLGARRVGSGCI